MKPHKFSIIMASFNKKEFIEEAILSVLNQTYDNYELIIIDGKSTDGTLEIAEKYRNQFPEKIKVYSEKDKGLYHARNKGIFKATGDIVSFLNTDDYYDKDALKNINDTFSKNDVDVVYGITTAVNKSGERLWDIGREFERRKFLSHFITIPDPSTFIKRHHFPYIGIYDTTLKFGGDGDFWQRCISRNLKFMFLKKNITYYRIYDDTLSYDPKLKWERFRETKKVHRRYYHKFFSPYITRLYFTYFIKEPLSRIKVIKHTYSKLKK